MLRLEGLLAARAITAADSHPSASLAGIAVPTQVRARPAELSPALVCALPIPPHRFPAPIEDYTLPLVPRGPPRIAVLGNSACRIAGARAGVR
ncbi:MAG: hypothetical protein RMM58_04550 [Chloroflexota bacterium]|nr:hypothetical protein [Chloroflexota bacterium]